MASRPVITLLALFLSTTCFGADRTITGHLTLPEIPDLSTYTLHLTTIVQSPQIVYPDDYIQWTPQQRHSWYLDYLKTDAGKAYKSALDQSESDKHTFIIPINKDGSFRAEEIPPATYHLQAEPPTSSNPTEPHYIATAANPIIIPPEASHEPFDLGAVELQATKSLNLGGIAPDFSVKTLDGKPLHLSDYKGKYILLDFWASWCGPCVAELPALKSTYAAHSSDPRFIILSLSLDTSTARAQHLVDKHQLTWPQGFLGDWFTSKPRDAYGVQSIPALFLISPDGKILAKNLSADQIEPAVSAALSK